MKPNKNDLLLAVDCATAVTFHYYDSIQITIVDSKTIEDLKQVALKHMKEDL